MNLVAVRLAKRVVRGVEPLGRRLDRTHHHVVGQQRVEAPDEPPRLERRAGLDADDLPLGVDARVGAAAGGERGFFTSDRPPRVLQHALHGRLRRLPLPTGVGRAVVRDGEFEPVGL
jgi:hypothetical protein